VAVTKALGPVTILDGNIFVVSDSAGDIDASPTDPRGLFAYDTRFLSTWALTIGGERLHAISVDDVQYFEARFFIVPGQARVYIDPKLSVIRHRTIRNGFAEQLTILNHGGVPADLTIRMEAGCDFADLFEVKDALAKRGRRYARVERDRLILGYERERFQRSTTITIDGPAEFDDHGLTLTAHVEPRGRWTARLQVAAVVIMPAEPDAMPRWRRGHAEMQRDLDALLNAAPFLECDWQPLKDTYRRSLVDIAALRFSPQAALLHSLPAAGLPWFMTILGRDSIFTSLQALPFTPDLAATTLRVLADWQGILRCDQVDEDPGRILHEVRYGETMAFEERPHSPYFGTADATPLFVVLLDEYERWSGDAELVRVLEYEARAALKWIDKYADLLGNGYIWYQRRNTTGLENQCWKDSWDSISYRDGRLPGFPRATCELQGVRL
jgi:glycogen debranching enzyme